MSYAQIIDGDPVEIAFPVNLDGALASYETVTIWSPEQRAEVGIYTIATDPPGRGERFTGDLFLDGGGVVRRETEPLPLESLLALVNADRDARINGGFKHTVDGVEYTFQSAPSDRENVMGMSMAAAASGGAAGNLRWYDPTKDFEWITADNTLAPMDAPQVVALFVAGAKFKAVCTYTARAYKDAMIAAGNDVAALAIFLSIVWPE